MFVSMTTRSISAEDLPDPSFATNLLERGIYFSFTDNDIESPLQGLCLSFCSQYLSGPIQFPLIQLHVLVP